RYVCFQDSPPERPRPGPDRIVALGEQNIPESRLTLRANGTRLPLAAPPGRESSGVNDSARRGATQSTLLPKEESWVGLMRAAPPMISQLRTRSSENF